MCFQEVRFKIFVQETCIKGLGLFLNSDSCLFVFYDIPECDRNSCDRLPSTLLRF